MKTYLVGGAVRDKLLERKLSDRDWVVVGATPDEMISQGYKQVGTDFPVFLHPQSKEEYALARTERKTAPGYTGFQVFAAPDVSLEDDLRRRDLTINAMAEDADGKLIDPYGGLKDLKQRKLRHVSEAFSEDPVRILRVARFAARYHQYGFTVAKSTHQLMSSMVGNGEAKALVSERVWQETKKALMEPFPSRFLEVLHDCGALAVLFPEIEAMYGVPQTAKYHPEIDCGVHLHLALDRAAKLYDDPLVMFAVLTHDLGKGITPEDVLPSHRGHESAGLPLIKALCKRLKVPTKYLKLALVVGEWHLHCHTAFELRSSSIIKLFGRCDAWRQPEQLERFFCACQADAQGRLGMSEKPYPQADFLRACFAAAGRINTKELLAKGLIGEALGQEIHKARIRAIAPIVKAGAQAF